MVTVEELKSRHPEHKIKYAPKESCGSCKGRGEYRNKNGDVILCICTCVGLDGIGSLFKEFVDKELQELRNNK